MKNELFYSFQFCIYKLKTKFIILKFYKLNKHNTSPFKLNLCYEKKRRSRLIRDSFSFSLLHLKKHRNTIKNCLGILIIKNNLKKQQ